MNRHDESPPSRSVAQLIETLRYGEAADRRAALAELAQIGHRSSEAVPDLIAILHDADPPLRTAAADALARIGDAAVAPLVEAMLTDNVDFRRTVIGTLGRFGPGAAAAIPILQAARSDAQLIADADAALAQIQPPAWAGLRRHLVGTLPSALLITGGVAVAVGAIAIVLWYANVLRPGNHLAMTLGAAIGLIGSFLGALIGGIVRRRIGALIGVAVLGLAGYLIGVVIGGWVSSLLGPLVR